ncbi:inositol monophosphatase family protein [Pseudoclavibacter helvolus]|uniref:inositol monophosphatase family protein n=1 Tax=Pseudoclavibacter helvolus TaxID=255205 RepID=UPI003C754A83
MTRKVISSIELAQIAQGAARGAGTIALEGFRSKGLGIDEKTNFHDLVTVYDVRAEQYIRGVIANEAPDSRIVGEEGGASGAGDVTWFIDPIDGTSNFARGIALWAVCIGAAVDGEVVAGVVYDPVADNMFVADERGAFLNGEGLRSEGATTPERATVLASFPLPRDLVHLRADALEAYAELEDTYSHVRDLGSSAITLTHVAAGWADAVFSFEASPWDVAAPAFILKRAGGIYRTYGDGVELPRESDHLHRHYYGTVAGADFPLIEALMRRQSTRPVPSVFTEV